ncbi:hypothetical protein V8F33_002639 [Rhypophila sp. PSN 637]
MLQADGATSKGLAPIPAGDISQFDSEDHPAAEFEAEADPELRGAFMVRDMFQITKGFSSRLSGGGPDFCSRMPEFHSESMAAAVRLLSDEAIIATYDLYCQNYPVVKTPSSE